MDHSLPRSLSRLEIPKVVHRRSGGKFKREYFAVGTSVQLGWLIDPKNSRIWVYKRNQHGNVFRREHAWEDVEGGNILPGFILEVWRQFHRCVIAITSM